MLGIIISAWANTFLCNFICNSLSIPKFFNADSVWNWLKRPQFHFSLSVWIDRWIKFDGTNCQIKHTEKKEGFVLSGKPSRDIAVIQSLQCFISRPFFCPNFLRYCLVGYRIIVRIKSISKPKRCLIRKNSVNGRAVWSDVRPTAQSRTIAIQSTRNKKKENRRQWQRTQCVTTGDLPEMYVCGFLLYMMFVLWFLIFRCIFN